MILRAPTVSTVRPLPLMDDVRRIEYLKSGGQFSFMLSWLPSTILLGAAEAGSLGAGNSHVMGVFFGLAFFTCLYFAYIFVLANSPLRRGNVFVLLALNVAIYVFLSSVLAVEDNTAAFALILGSIVGLPLLVVTMDRHTDWL